MFIWILKSNLVTWNMWVELGPRNRPSLCLWMVIFNCDLWENFCVRVNAKWLRWILWQARKALYALRGIVRLQALVRGQLVRKQAMATVRCMEALLIAQDRAFAQRIRMASVGKSNQRHPTHLITTQDNFLRHVYNVSSNPLPFILILKNDGYKFNRNFLPCCDISDWELSNEWNDSVSLPGLFNPINKNIVDEDRFQ